MNELQNLVSRQEELLAKIHHIEEACEGIENKNNARKIAELNLRQGKLSRQKNELQAKLATLENELRSAGAAVQELSGTGAARILEAIKQQRWFFFKNKPEVLLDRDTGLLWNNPAYIPFLKANGSSFGLDEAKKMSGEAVEIAGWENWKIVNALQFEKIARDDSGYPYYTGGYYQIANESGVIMDRTDTGYIQFYWTDNDYRSGKATDHGIFLICNAALVSGSVYEADRANDKIYTENERLQFTLDLFVNHGLEPIFDDAEAVQLYRQIYIEKPALLEQLADVEMQLEALQQTVQLSSAFDYTVLLADYDISAIDGSVIQYYQAVLSLADDFLEKLAAYEEEKSSTIRDFNAISLKLGAKYKESPQLTEEENRLLAERQKFLAKHLDLGMDTVKKQLLAVKRQAEELEDRMEEINCGSQAIAELAVLEKEDRAGFSLLAENMANMVKQFLLKSEFFEQNRSYVSNIIVLWDAWTEYYKIFKTKMYEELKASCEEESIEEEVYQGWYEDWQKKRLRIEQQFLPLAAFSLKGNLLEMGFVVDLQQNTATKPNTKAEQVLLLLQEYKEGIDRFYLENRKNIYQKFAFQAGGDLQEKFETESELYKQSMEFQKKLQDIIFALDGAEERLFLLKWAAPLLDIQVDAIVDFVRDRDLAAVSREVLTQFADLKRQNFAAYLSDSQAYREALQQREKEYNSLIFKMRKDLMKA